MRVSTRVHPYSEPVHGLGMEQNNLMTCTELAARLGLRSRDVKQAAEAGEIPSVKVGREGLLFDISAVARVLEARAGLTKEREGRHGS